MTTTLRTLVGNVVAFLCMILKEPIPLHRHHELSDACVELRIVNSDDLERRPVEYAHRDDYYIFGIIVSGSLSCEIDFKRYTVSEGELQFIRPGQVHRFLDGDRFEALMLISDSGLVDESYRHVFEASSLRGVSIVPQTSDSETLKSLFLIIQSRLSGEADPVTVRHLVMAFIGMFADEFRLTTLEQSECSDRNMAIAMKFKSLITTDIHISRSPSYYAYRLNISSVYLNEITNKVMATSASACIRDEIILRAKRLLYYTDMTVKEIADALGFEDHAYFCRYFAKAAGMPPLKFRQKH